MNIDKKNLLCTMGLCIMGLPQCKTNVLFIYNHVKMQILAIRERNLMRMNGRTGAINETSIIKIYNYVL